jgi:hypothetical protein
VSLFPIVVDLKGGNPMRRQFRPSVHPIDPLRVSLQTYALLALILVLTLIATTALAEPPTMPLPSEASNDEDLLAQFWGWGNYALEILLILIGAAIFVMVTWSVVANFIEVSRTGGSFLGAVPRLGVGLFVLAITGVLLTIAWNVLQNTTLTP